MLPDGSHRDGESASGSGSVHEVEAGGMGCKIHALPQSEHGEL